MGARALQRFRLLESFPRLTLVATLHESDCQQHTAPEEWGASFLTLCA